MLDQLYLWIIFGGVIALMLFVDLWFFHRKAHVVTLQEAILWSIIWISIALLFNLLLYFTHGHESALKFFTGYIIEKSLSVDNLFVFLMIFTFFSVPEEYQHKVLFWGILGALLMRGVFIAAGVSLIQSMHWTIYIFGAFLVVTGVRVAFQKEQQLHPERNPVLQLFRRFFPITSTYAGNKFFTRENGKLFATPLFVTLLVIETTDLVFATDSIPAILGITTDPFIVYTSNIFAILGLRALYFVLAGVMQLFRYLHYGLAVVLVFIGVKMLIEDFYPIPIGISLGVVGGILLVSVLASMKKK